MKKILIVGSSNTDLVAAAPAFPKPGETIMGTTFMRNHGGKGANQAVAAARLGGHVAFIGKIGSDSFGQAALNNLRAEGIDTSCVTIAPNSPSGIALITVAGGENTIIVCPGANSLLTEADIDAAAPLFQQAAIVLMQLETPVPALIRAAQIAKQCGAMVVLNSAPAPTEPLSAELLSNVDILIPNETEAERITHIPITSNESIAQAMDTLQAMGIGRVLITLGSRGVAVRQDGQIIIHPAQKTTPVDTTGAGDTFCGAFCVALSQDKPMPQAIQFAQKAAAISITRLGAQNAMPRIEEMM